MSTINSAGWRAASIAARISGMRLVTPVEVSLWTTQTAFSRCSRSAASFSATCAGSTPCRQSPGTNSMSSPSRVAICRHSAREMTGLDHQHPVARRQRVDERGLPRPGAGGRIDDHRARGLEHPLHAGDDLLAELGEFRAAMIDRRHRDRLQHPVGHVGRAGDLQEMAAGMAGQSGFSSRGSSEQAAAVWRGNAAATMTEEACLSPIVPTLIWIKVPFPNVGQGTRRATATTKEDDDVKSMSDRMAQAAAGAASILVLLSVSAGLLAVPLSNADAGGSPAGALLAQAAPAPAAPGAASSSAGQPTQSEGLGRARRNPDNRTPRSVSHHPRPGSSVQGIRRCDAEQCCRRCRRSFRNEPRTRTPPRSASCAGTRGSPRRMARR